MDNKVKEEDRYTQRQWDRTVGWGRVPKKYDKEHTKERNNDVCTGTNQKHYK